MTVACNGRDHATDGVHVTSGLMNIVTSGTVAMVTLGETSVITAPKGFDSQDFLAVVHASGMGDRRLHPDEWDTMSTEDVSIWSIGGSLGRCH